MKIKFDSKQFYQHHPDLAPRNVYLANGRVIKKEEIDKVINKICRDSFLTRTGKKIKNFWNKIAEFCVKKN